MVSPGGAYGPNGEGFFRISLTVPDERLTEAVERLRSVSGAEMRYCGIAVAGRATPQLCALEEVRVARAAGAAAGDFYEPGDARARWRPSCARSATWWSARGADRRRRDGSGPATASWPSGACCRCVHCRAGRRSSTRRLGHRGLSSPAVANGAAGRGGATAPFAGDAGASRPTRTASSPRSRAGACRPSATRSASSGGSRSWWTTT